MIAGGRRRLVDLNVSDTEDVQSMFGELRDGVVVGHMARCLHISTTVLVANTVTEQMFLLSSLHDRERTREASVHSSRLGRCMRC